MARKDLLSTDLVRDRHVAALALHVGDHRPLSQAMLAQETGCELRTVRAHLYGETTPPLATWLAYAEVLPDSYANALLGLAGLGGARRLGAAPAPTVALAEMAEGVAALADALADGRIDHTERPTVIKELREAISAAEALVAALENTDRGDR
ncbi:hypothetical protein [Phaeospirillum tilakii]|uniref:Uncharacterized protein n=1 Tax=Phaeospirillum tilakii TaxID=741673 RepID=A0ABW5CDB5_9PROT